MQAIRCRWVGAGNDRSLTQYPKEDFKISKDHSMSRIRIFCPTSTTCVVDPGQVHVKSGTKVTLMATNTGAIVLFPTKDLFDRQVVPIKRGRAVSLTVKAQKKRRGRYPYAVFSTHCRSFGIGGSEPEMIVP